MTMNDIEKNAFALLDFLEQRGMTPQEACAVMGFAITALIADQPTGQEFVRTLKNSLMHRWANVEVH